MTHLFSPNSHEQHGRFLNDEPILAHPLSGTKFETTRWMNSEYSHGYLEHADEIIPERCYLFHMLGSFLRLGSQPASCSESAPSPHPRSPIRSGDTAAIVPSRSAHMVSPATSASRQILRIGLVGDYHPEVTAHRAIVRSLELAVGQFSDWQLDVQWLPTDAREQFADNHLSGFDGLWCVPASPYASMEGALRGIQFAREQAVPFLGTCAGFQHTLIEYARNVLGRAEADHEETRPEGQCLVISRLTCPLVEKQGDFVLLDGTVLRRIYGRATGIETYHCNFGLSRDHEAMFEGERLKVSARDLAGRAHAVELEGHPFFLATLFQPERSGLQGEVHPVVRSFVQATLHQREKAAA